MIRTQTPWKKQCINPNRDIIVGNGGRKVVSGADHPFCDDESDNNLLMIVECVNACAEINPLNPAGAGKHLVETVRAAEEIMQFWDEYCTHDADERECKMFNALRDALAKMKGYV